MNYQPDIQTRPGPLRKGRLVAAVVAVLMGLSACETAVEPALDAAESDDMVEMLTSELSLSSSESQEVALAVESTDQLRVRREPGWSWALADSLQAVLTSDQKARLIALTERFEEREVFGLVCFVGPGGLTGPDWRDRPVFKNRFQVLRLISELLSEEQITEIRTILERRRSEMKALVEQVRQGEITREQFVDAVQALHEASLEAVYALLTDDQIAALEQHIQDRIEAFEAIVAATKRAMYDALDATESQIASIESLCDRISAEKDALLEQHFSGDLTREELKTSLNALNEIEKEELEQTLDATQMEVVLIHKAILLRWRRIEMRRHRRGADGRFTASDGGELFGDRPNGFN